MIMGNRQTDELAVLVKNGKTYMYRECSLLCFTETWLTASIPDANVELAGLSALSGRTEKQKPVGSKKEEDSLFT